MDKTALDKYILERQTIFNSLSDAIIKGITNKLEQICKAYYADKGIPLF